MTSMQLRIGLTATGGDMAASAMLSLRQNLDVKYYIHAFNSEYCQLSSSIADQFDVIPLGTDPSYALTVIEFVKRSGLQVLMPWSDEEAIALSEVRNDLIKIGCEVLVSPPEVLKELIDKSKTYDKLKKAGLNVPEYTLISQPSDLDYALKFYGYPERTVVIKPADGRGGRGVNVLLGNDNPPDWLGSGRRERRIQSFNGNEFNVTPGIKLLVMPRLQAPVYDVDIFRLRGAEIQCFVRERNNPTGIPYDGNILRINGEIEEYAKNIAECMNLESLHDIDMMTDPRSGPVLLEINPRPSGSLTGLSSAGYRLLDYALASAIGVETELKRVQKEILIRSYRESVAFS